MEEAFPYEETPDQLAAIADVKADMQSPKPMDRLRLRRRGLRQDRGRPARRLQGNAGQEAGHGALPHNHSGAAALPDVPRPLRAVRRARGGAEPLPHRGAAEGRARGLRERRRCTVLVGTHRLLSQRREPPRPGPRDHRRGAALRRRSTRSSSRTCASQVDVLTLSATPIPRTMQMAVSGVRDMSLIKTPPPEPPSRRRCTWASGTRTWSAPPSAASSSAAARCTT